MNVDRLRTLSAHLKTLKPQNRKRHFNMDSWAVKYGKKYKAGRRISCGTAACAAGEAAYIPEFRAAGLAIAFDRRRSFDGNLYGTVTFDGLRQLPAAQKFFDLTEKQAKTLFMDYSQPSPRAVARRIDNLLYAQEQGWLDDDSSKVRVSPFGSIL